MLRLLVSSSAVLVLVLASFVSATPLVHTSGELFTCDTATISWSASSGGPYTIYALPGGQTSAQAIETIAENVQGLSYDWQVNLPPGAYISLAVANAAAGREFSAPFTVYQGEDEDCLAASAPTATATSVAVASPTDDAPPPSCPVESA